MRMDIWRWDDLVSSWNRCVPPCTERSDVAARGTHRGTRGIIYLTPQACIMLLGELFATNGKGSFAGFEWKVRDICSMIKCCCLGNISQTRRNIYLRPHTNAHIRAFLLSIVSIGVGRQKMKQQLLLASSLQQHLTSQMTSQPAWVSISL